MSKSLGRDSFRPVSVSCIATIAILLGVSAAHSQTPATKPPTLVNGTLLPAPTTFDFGNGRRLTIGGFIEARFEQVSPYDSKIAPEGGLGAGNGYNGSYYAGSDGSTFKIRESRLAFSGVVSPNTKFVAELGTPGALNVSATGSAQVFVRRLYGQYTFGDGSPKNLSLTTGQFWVPFGFALNTPRPLWYQTERPLAFGEGSNGLFASQEFDRGVKLEWMPQPYGVTLAVVDGTGATSNDNNRGKDVVARFTYRIAPGFNAGASGYFGKLSVSRPATGEGQAATTVNDARKNLLGLDLQYVLPTGGPFVQAEYVGGKYEAIPPARLANAGATPPVTLSDIVPGNKVEGYYLVTGWTFDAVRSHPWNLVAGYDVFRRRKSEGSYTDENLGFGASYNLDRGVRARLYYIHPNRVAHAPTAAAPRKLGLLTAEMQFLF